MKTLLLAIMLLTGLAAFSQSSTTKQDSRSTKPGEMKTYVIEREIAGAGNLNQEELKGISQKSCGVLKEMGSGIQWMHSYVTGNKIYCVYKAENAELVKEHAKKGGFPANSIAEVANVISPETAE